MPIRLNISWPTLLAEGVAIVVSILLALWVQAWWEDRTAQIKTEELLLALEYEWESDLIAIDTVLEDARRVSEAMMRLIQAHQSASPLSNAEAATLLDQQRGWHTYKPSTDALDVVLDYGLDNIENIELRMAIVAWPDEFRDVAAEKEFVEELSLIHQQGEWSRIAHSLGSSSWELVDDPISDRWFGVHLDELAPAVIADSAATLVNRRVLDMLSQYQRQLAQVRAVLADN